METEQSPGGMRRVAERLTSRIRSRPAIEYPGHPLVDGQGNPITTVPAAMVAQPYDVTTLPTIPIPAHIKQPTKSLQISARPRSRKTPSPNLLMHLLSLPPELQELVLSHLDFGDIERLRRTCHFFRNRIDKAMIRRLFPDLKEMLLSTCYHCLTPQTNNVRLVRAEETDARYPLASRCFTCVAQRSGFMVGRKYTLGNSLSVWVCRWCGYPVASLPAWNQPEFHIKCFQKYNRILLLYFLLGCAQWAIVIIASALCWRYFKHDKLVLAPTIVNFIMSMWVFCLSVVRGASLRTYHWGLFVELAILALWIPPVVSIARHIAGSSGHPPNSTLATLGFIGINMLFRLLNVFGNLILLCEYRMWQRKKPSSSLVQRVLSKLTIILVFWTDPQSMEQEYPPKWWFSRRTPATTPENGEQEDGIV